MDIALSTSKGRSRLRDTLAFKLFKWFVIPILVVCVAEGAARMGLKSYGPWYSQAGSVDFVFIGSSRVASAIDEQTFASVMSRQVGRRVRVLNLGRGDSTAAEQALGLRNLDHSMPAASRNYVLFIETPGGLPDTLMQGTWEDPWVFPEAKGLIARMLRGEDIAPMWDSHMGFGTKLELTSEWLTQRSSLVTYSAGWRDIVINRTTTFLGDSLAKVDPRLRAPVSQPSNLRSGGGVRRDPSGIQAAREAAMALQHQDLSKQQPWGDWDSQILADIVRTHEANGGQVVFYDMPLSSYFQRSYKTPLRAHDREVFTRQESLWRTPHLHPAFSTTDADFPDLRHLAADRAPAFTQAIADAWVASSCADRSAVQKVSSGAAHASCPASG